MAKLTKIDVKNAKNDTGKDVFLWDESPRGFGLKVTPAGKKTYLVKARVRGDRAKKTFTIGSADAITLDEARREAGDILGMLAKGIDPGAEKKAAAAAAAAAVQASDDADLRRFSKVLDDYLVRRVRGRLRDAKHVEGLLRLHLLERWKDRDVATITRADVLAVLEGLEAEGKHGAARKVRGVVSPLFVYAVQRGLMVANPADGRGMLAKPVQFRDRVLNAGELAEVWQAAEVLDWPFGRLVKLLILTGQRLREVAEADWSEFDLDNSTWTIPATRAKNKKTHVVHLSPQVVEVLETLPRFRDCGWLFSTNGETPISGFSRAKRAFDREIAAARAKAADGGDFAEIPAWTLHDLRRSFASGAAAIGVQMHIVERVLNHVPAQLSGVAAVYQRHQFEQERKAAVEAWGRHIESLVTGAASNVVQFRRA